MPDPVLSHSFSITCASLALQTDAQGKGSCAITVTNTGAASNEGRLRLAATGQEPASLDWLKLVEPPEGKYKPNETRRFTVAIAVPPTVRDGVYLFRAEAYAVANPNEDFICGPEIALTVKRAAPVARKFPIWIPIVAVLGLLLIGGIITAVVLAGGHSSDAPAGVAVPSVVGESLDAATAALKDKGFAVGKVDREKLGKDDAGVVLSQSPAAEAQLAPGGGVDLVLGPAGTAPPRVAVPDLKGRTQVQAGEALQALKLKLGPVTEDAQAAGADGTVVRQEPAAAASAPVGSAVAVVIKAKAATPPPAPAIAWQGTFSVRQTWLGDVDGARECTASERQDADFWFEAVTATERFLQPENGAKFAFVEAATREACREAIAQSPQARIAIDRLKPGALLACFTRTRGYTVLSPVQAVGPSPGVLTLRYLHLDAAVKVAPGVHEVGPVPRGPARPFEQNRALEVGPAIKPQREILNR